MIAWFSIAPDDGSGSYSPHVAAAIRILRESGLPYRLGSMGTEVEGPRDAVFALLARCHHALATAPGVKRTATVIKIDDRADVESGELERKVASVEGKV
ncbi:MAG TPA: MTH1187 family thiamine-binding protein [Candidatus Binatia bacterium]|nr:MTH1187 family thiamine-binding protein [Candidatus Binatia bacterium]